MNSALHVALPISSFLPVKGGAEMTLHNIAMCLQERGDKPFVITASKFIRRLNRRGIRLPYDTIAIPDILLSLSIRLPQIGLPIVQAFFSNLQKRYSFDVWHCNIGYPFGPPTIGMSQAQNGTHIPHVILCQGADLQVRQEIGYGWRLNPTVDHLVRKWYPRSQRVVAISKSMVEEFQKLGIADERIVEIPNGVDTRRFKKEVDRRTIRKNIGIEEDAFVILSVGRNHPKKGFRFLLETHALLQERSKNKIVTLLVGPGMSELQSEYGNALPKGLKTIDDLDALFDQQHDDLSVPSERLVEVYLSCDLFAFPTLLESFGIVTVEAMAAGLPIVTNNVSGSNDLVTDGYNGVLVPPREPKKMADAILNIIEQPLKVEKLVTNARETATEFDWYTVTDRYRQLYVQVIEEASKRVRII